MRRAVSCLTGLVFLALTLIGAAAAAEKMTYSVGWVIYGRDIGWLVARDKGYYKAEGLDVQIVRGYGGADTAKKLGAGSYEVAGVVAASVIFGRAAGAPIKMIGMQHDRVPFVLRTVAGRGIEKPKDIEGRKLGTPAGDATWANMPAFARINGIDMSKVQVINTSPTSRGPALLAGAFDVATGFITEYPLLSRQASGKGLKLVDIPMADHGLDVYAFGPATTDKVIAERGDLVKKFMRASARGFAEAIRSPDEGIDLLIKQEPSQNREIQKEVWFISLTTMLTPAQRANGLFAMTDEKWGKTRDMIAKAKPELGKIALSDLYTNGFLSKILPPANPKEMEDYLKSIGQ